MPDMTPEMLARFWIMYLDDQSRDMVILSHLNAMSDEDVVKTFNLKSHALGYHVLELDDPDLTADDLRYVSSDPKHVKLRALSAAQANRWVAKGTPEREEWFKVSTRLTNLLKARGVIQ